MCTCKRSHSERTQNASLQCVLRKEELVAKLYKATSSWWFCISMLQYSHLFFRVYYAYLISGFQVCHSHPSKFSLFLQVVIFSFPHCKQCSTCTVKTVHTGPNSIKPSTISIWMTINRTQDTCRSKNTTLLRRNAMPRVVAVNPCYFSLLDFSSILVFARSRRETPRSSTMRGIPRPRSLPLIRG